MTYRRSWNTERQDWDFLCPLCLRPYTTYQGLTYHMTKALKSSCRLKLNEPTLITPKQHDVSDYQGEYADADDVVQTMLTYGRLSDSVSQKDKNGHFRIRGYIPGYRAWRVGRFQEEYRLFPIFQRKQEPYGRGVLSAVCNASTYSTLHAAPDPSCSCGYYAMWDSQMIKSNLRRGGIMGRLLAWGRILPGELGWRAQYVMIDGIIQPVCGGKGLLPMNCERPVVSYLAYPLWTQVLSPSGAVYPRSNSKQYISYRNKANFISGDSSRWYCETHTPVSAEYQRIYEVKCGYFACNRTANFVVGRANYCAVHSPLVLPAQEVLGSLSRYYGIYVQREEELMGKLVPDGGEEVG